MRGGVSSARQSKQSLMKMSGLNKRVCFPITNRTFPITNRTNTNTIDRHNSNSFFFKKKFNILLDINNKNESCI